MQSLPKRKTVHPEGRSKYFTQQKRRNIRKVQAQIGLFTLHVHQEEPEEESKEEPKEEKGSHLKDPPNLNTLNWWES